MSLPDCIQGVSSPATRRMLRTTIRSAAVPRQAAIAAEIMAASAVVSFAGASETYDVRVAGAAAGFFWPLVSSQWTRSII